MKLIFLTLLIVVSITAFASRDYYDILDVPRDAPKSLIKQHFKKLSRVYHPDKNPGDSSASEKFMEIAQAYEILSNDEKRNTYDRFGEEGVKRQEQRQQQNADQNPFGRAQGKPKTPNIEIPLQVTLEDLYNGIHIEVDVAKHVTCNHCFGSGAHDSDSIRTCSTCEGQGSTLRQVRFGPGFVQQFQQECEKCSGKGKTITKACKACYGRKIRRGTEQYTVVVDKGMSTDQTIVFEEGSNEAPDRDPGDIVFHIKTLNHPVFTRRGNDLYTRLTINLIEALTGFSKSINHLDQTPVHFKRSGVTQYGFIDTIMGAAMPLVDNPDEFGDLYVEYIVQFSDYVDTEFVKELQKHVPNPTRDEF